MKNTIRVVELTSGVAASYAAKLLGDAGADVIKVEPPAGDDMRRWHPSGEGDSGLFQALNVNKHSVCLDLRVDRAHLAELLRWADILVHGLDRSTLAELGLGPDEMRTSHPKLVTLGLTPFGLSGPYADYQACELILSNAGGWANLCPATHSDPALPPLKVYGEQCSLMAAIAGAATALACLYDTRRCRVGEYIDLSIQAYVASVLEAGIPAYAYRGDVVTRHHPRSLIPWRIFQAQDAPVFIVCVEQDQWERLVEFMGHPEWADLEIFADQPARAENQDMVHMFVQEFVSQWRAEDLYHAAQQHRICIAPVLNLAQISQDPHLQSRNFFVDVEGVRHLAPSVLSSGQRAPVRFPAPGLAQHQSRLTELPTPHASVSVDQTNVQTGSRKPLAGVRVLDLSWAWAGPFCGMNLAHLGAEVIRLESATRPDLYRRLPFFAEGVPETLDSSGMFNQWNQGKFSIGLNLNQPAAVDMVKELVKHSDVVLQNFATGVMQRLGLDFDTLQAINPRIILASISGYGQSGPYKTYMGYGPAMPPLTGLSAATGYVDGEAEEIGLSMPDPTAGITAALGIVSSLHRVAQTGMGEHLDVSLWEATGVLNMEGWMQYELTGQEPRRMGNRSPRMAPHGVFPCAGEDRWVAIACRDDDEWQRLAELLDPDDTWQLSSLDSLQARKQHEPRIEEMITAWTRNQDRWAITGKLQALQIAAFPTLSCADIVNDKHLNARQFIERKHHPVVGERPHTGIPWRLAQRPNGVTRPAPCLGQDTKRLLKDLLNLTDARIKALSDTGAISL